MCRLGANRLSLATGADLSTSVTGKLPGSGSGNSLELPISVNNYKVMASSAAHVTVLEENGKYINMFKCVICSKLLQVSVLYDLCCCN